MAARPGCKCWPATTTPPARWISRSIRPIRIASSPRCGITSASPICAPTAASARAFTDRPTAAQHWQRLTSGLPVFSDDRPDRDRPAASNPQRLYAIVNQTSGPFQGFYQSDDGGDTWTKLPNNSTLSGAQSTYGWWFGAPLGRSARSGPRLRGRGLSLRVEEQRFDLHGAFSPHADDHAMAWDRKCPAASISGNEAGLTART